MPRDMGDDLTESVESRPPAPLDGFAMLRVWVETGYDRGRFAGWVPDVPGVLAVAPTPERALSLAVTNTARVREWLEAHGDEAPIPRIWRAEAAGDVATTVLADGYEVQATLPADRRRVTEEDVEVAARRLGWVRDDLLTLGERIGDHEAAVGRPLETRGDHGERSADEVMRHVAGTEAWLVGRMPNGGRYPGPIEGVAVREALDGTRAWALDRLRALAASDDGRETPDRHGETWTLAKVLRRLQAHGFDHAWELERRL